MSFYKLTKILPPFFPDTNWLRQQWWHRLILVISLSISLLSLAILFFSLTGVLNEVQEIWEIERVANSISLPENPDRRLKVISAFKPYSGEEAYEKINSRDLGEKVVKIYPEYDKYESETLGKAILYRYPSYREIAYYWAGDYEVDRFFYLGVFSVIIGIYGPNIFYRIFLYVVTNDSWKRKNV